MERVQCELHETVTLTKIYNCLEDGPLSMPVQDISTAFNYIGEASTIPWLGSWTVQMEKES